MYAATGQYLYRTNGCVGEWVDSAQAGSLYKSENSSFFLPRYHKMCCLSMGLMGLNMGKVSRVRKKLVGSAVFLKLVRPLDFSDPTCAENRVNHVCGIFSVLKEYT